MLSKHFSLEKEKKTTEKLCHLRKAKKCLNAGIIFTTKSLNVLLNSKVKTEIL